MSWRGVHAGCTGRFDIVFSALAFVLLSPVFLAIAIAIHRDDPGPIIFRQQRIGLNGKPFTIHRFRSMSVDAESKLALLRSQSMTDGPPFKTDDDPRITRVGRVLRKYSLDELPQFWTVLRGSMSIAGPRPHLEKELDEFPDEGLRRLLIKPGITGLWQVSGRSDLSLEDSVKLDLRYVQNWSLLRGRHNYHEDGENDDRATGGVLILKRWYFCRSVRKSGIATS